MATTTSIPMEAASNLMIAIMDSGKAALIIFKTGHADLC